MFPKSNSRGIEIRNSKVENSGGRANGDVNPKVASTPTPPLVKQNVEFVLEKPAECIAAQPMRAGVPSKSSQGTPECPTASRTPLENQGTISLTNEMWVHTFLLLTV